MRYSEEYNEWLYSLERRLPEQEPEFEEEFPMDLIYRESIKSIGRSDEKMEQKKVL